MVAAIDISDLSKSYGEIHALEKLDLSIKQGEIFGFLGHNGAGKTTTIHILTTLLQPTSGSARISGHDVVNASMKARQCIGYVPENVRLYGSLSTTDNLMFFARLSGVVDAAARIREALAFLECSDLASRRIDTLSKGQRQRIGLAQAILHRPAVLFLDEPTSGLDPLGIKTLRDLIVKLNTEYGTTIFMNTHLISEVAKTCTSIAVLNQGRLVLHDTLSAVLARYGDEASLEQLYLKVAPQREAA